MAQQVRETGVLPPSKIFFNSAGTRVPPWYLTLLCAGRFICDSDYTVSRACYDSGLLLQVLSGRGYVAAGERQKPLRAGDFLLLDCFSPHSYGTQTGWEIVWVHFTGKPAQSVCASMPERAMVLNAGSVPPEMGRKLLSLHKPFESGTPLDEAGVHCAITELVTAFFRPPEQQAEPMNMDRIISALSEHLSDGISNEELARMAHMSESQFIRVFRQHKGLTPHQYLLRLRLSAAQYYLTSSDMTLARIAEYCGFTDASALTNSFRRAFGITPREYASRHG